jgi:DNA-binding ferritin-like protein
LQPSDSCDLLLVAVEHELSSLEALCGEVERALMHRDWKRMDAAIADTRRITHGLRNAMDAARDVLDETFTETINRRLRYVHAIRENQMTRLQQYQDAVSERLRLIARWKSALRSMGKPQPARPQLGSLDHLT